MTQAPEYEAPEGTPFFGIYLRSISDAFAGNGILATGDAKVTADGNTDMGIQVGEASVGILYDGTTHTPTSSSFGITGGPTTSTANAEDRRVDIVVFNSKTAAYDVIEGTPDPNPSPPDLPEDTLLLAVVVVSHAAEQITDGDIHNWRSFPALTPTSPVESDNLADGSVTQAKVSDAAITASKLADDSVTAAKIAANSVASANIVDDSVTAAKIADDAVTNRTVNDGAVEAAQLAAQSVTGDKIAISAVGTTRIEDGAVTQDKLADGVSTGSGGGVNVEDTFAAEGNVSVAGNDTEVIAFDGVPVGKKVSIRKGTLVEQTGGDVPGGVYLFLAVQTGAGTYEFVDAVISGDDGFGPYAGRTGDLAEYEFYSLTEEHGRYALVVDNRTPSPVDVYAAASGESNIQAAGYGMSGYGIDYGDNTAYGSTYGDPYGSPADKELYGSEYGTTYE